MCKLAEYYNVSVGTLIGKNDYSRVIEYLNLCIDDLENNKNEYISNSKNYDYPKNTPYRVDSRVKNAFLDLLKGIKKNIESDTFSDKKLSNLSTVYVDLER
jgi:hypothetical protein